MAPRRASHLTAAAAVALAALALVAGCGEKSEQEGAPQRLALALDWFPNPDHAGIYTALERGYFEDAGLEVSPEVPSDPSAPIRQVAAGRADLAISYEPEVLLAREQGLDVVAVGALVREPLTSLISLGKDVASPRDLDGKRVATAGIPYQDAYLRAILERAGVEPDAVEQVDVGLNLISPLLAGRVDAVLGMFWNVEGVQLRRRGERPRIWPVDRLGIPTYDELVLVASADALDSDPEPIRLFLAALERGTRAATSDPEAATAALLAANDDLEPKLTRAQVRATLPVLLPRGGERPYGFMDPAEWREFSGFVFDQGLIGERPAPGELLSNDLLPRGVQD